MSEFEEAVKRVNDNRHLAESISKDKKLKMYGLYKQATLGCPKEGRPGGFLNLEAKAKWDAWDAVRTFSKTKAKEEYVTLVRTLE